MLVKVVDGIDDKEDHYFLETLLVAYPLLGVGFLIREAIEVPSTWPWQEFPEKVTDHCKQEGVLIWRSTCQKIFKDEKTKEYCNLPLMTVGCSYFLLLRFGWPAFAAIHLPVIAWVPRRPGQEFRQGHYPEWHPHTLDEDYCIVMMFDTFSKELYSLKQGSMKNVAKFEVHLLQQVQILQLEYPGRIKPEYIEGMKHDCFYRGLNPEYWWVLAHKLDSEPPSSYSNLLLVA